MIEIVAFSWIFGGIVAVYIVFVKLKTRRNEKNQ